MNRDLVVGVVGAAILVAAMVGVFYYEKNNVAPSGGGPAGTLTNATGPTAKGTTNVGATSDQLVNINQTNLVNVTFTLKWTAAQGRDTLKLTVAPPAGISEGGVAGPSDSGTLTTTIRVPQNATGGALGVGEWKVSVQFVSASTGAPVTPPVTPPVGTDASVAWTVTSDLQSREP